MAIVINWNDVAHYQSLFNDYVWQDDIGFSAQYAYFSLNDITIVTDSRIDNKEDLCKSLSLSTTIADAQLCWYLYKHYGEAIFNKLYGDFAVIIFDNSKKQVLAATDLFGIRPLYYTYLADGLLLSFSVKDILNNAVLSKTPNTKKLISYLTIHSALICPNEHTFFEKISVVKSGFFIKVTPTSFDKKFYWEVPSTPLKYANEAKYTEDFSYIFTNSVRACIKGYDRVACQLSGGIDSNAITAVAHQVNKHSVWPLHIDAGFETTNEKTYIYQFTDFTGLDVQILKPNPDVLEATFALLENLQMPSYYLHPFSFFQPLFDTIKNRKYELMLTGHDGDSVVGFGEAHFEKLIENKDWKNLEYFFIKELEKDFTPIFAEWKSWPNAQKYHFVVQQKLFSQFKKAAKNNRLIQHLYILHHEFEVPYSSMIKFIIYKLKHWKGLSDISRNSLIKPEILEPYNAVVLPEFDYFDNIEKLYKEYLMNILNNDFFQINQETTALSRAYNFEVAHPFMSRRLLEFNMFVPDKVKFGASGIGRMPLRESLKGVLPESIRMRRSKTYFDQYGEYAIKKLLYDGDLLETTHPIWGYIDRRLFDKYRNKLLSNKVTKGVFQIKLQLYRSYLWGLWLNQQK